MKITRDRVEACAQRKKNHRFEAVIGPIYRRPDGTVGIDAMHDFARLNGLLDACSRYENLNTGQIAMNVRNRLRSLWLRNELSSPAK